MPGGSERTDGAIGERAAFLSAFLRAPLATGAIAPSSAGLARRMVEGLDLAQARTVVEVGPGTGAFTRVILDACSTEALVLAVELNPTFATRLAQRHPALHVVHDSVENLPGLLRERGRAAADVVLSGLPWALMDEGVQARLLGGIAHGLRPGGWFATFGYVHCAVLPSHRRFLRLLARDFGDVQRSPVVWRNLPPALVYRARKRP